MILKNEPVSNNTPAIRQAVAWSAVAGEVVDVPEEDELSYIGRVGQLKRLGLTLLTQS